MNNKLNDNNIFETSDFQLVVVLVTLGFQLESLNKDNPLRVVFLFQNNSELQEAIKKYWSNQLVLNPQLLFASQKTLKSYLRA